MDETEVQDQASAMTPGRLAAVSIVLIVGATAALVAADRAMTNRFGSQSLTRSSWFWVAAALTAAAAVVAVLALRASRARGISGSWAALSMGLVVLFVLAAAYMSTLSSSNYVVEGRPRRRRARGISRGCPPGSHRPVRARRDEGRAVGPAGRELSDAELGPIERAFLHEMWTTAAAHEAESIATFLQLRAELEVLGAPPALCARAASAAGDEVRHTRVALAIADRARPRSAPPAIDPTGARSYREPAGRSRTRSGRRYRVLRLAAEAYLDGCCNEAVAAARLHRAATAPGTPFASVLARIAREEQRHVELAWSTVEWSAAEGGPLVVWTLRRLRPRPPRTGSTPPPGADAHLLRRWGWVDPASTADAFEATRRAAQRRLLDLSS